MTVALTCVGCDLEGYEYVEDLPPPEVVNVKVTAGVDGDDPIRVEVDDDGTTTSLTTTSVHVHFNRYIDPRTAIRQAYCLRSDQADVPGNEFCTGAVANTLPRYDPVTRTLSIFIPADTRLPPDTLFKLTVLAPRNATDFGIRAFDGAPMAQTVVKTFRTLDEVPPIPDTEQPPDDASAPSCFNVSDYLNSKCGSCHSIDAPTSGFAVEDFALKDLVGKAAHQTQVGGDASRPQVRAEKFGVAMPLIDANRSPGNSYILYKALARQPVLEDTLHPEETQRLRNTLITGLGMPADPATDPLDEKALTAISQWIAAGARCE